jgi:hypothetical protein
MSNGKKRAGSQGLEDYKETTVKIILEIQDNKRANTLVEVLSQLSFVKIEKGKEKRLTKKKFNALDNIFGIWKDRNISKGSLRSHKAIKSN